MSLALGEKLKIRAMVYTAAEPIPLFWPMRSFIHHNPLHGLEHMPFDDAVQRGRNLFHGRAFLARRQYQRYLANNAIDPDQLAAGVEAFVATQVTVPGLDLQRWLMALLTEQETPVTLTDALVQAADVHMLLQGAQPGILNSVEEIPLAADLRRTLLGDRPLYEAVDALCGTAIGVELDQLVIKSCLEFFDEGQSVWGMPGRERGLFNAWRELARRNARLFMRGLDVKHILAAAECPEGVIAHVMQQLGVVERHWVGCFTRELARLHGWAGFIRWRSIAREYHWAQHRPADLVDFLALRLTLALALLREHGRRGMPDTAAGIGELVDGRTREAYLRRELYDGHVLPAFALCIEQVLSVGDDARIAETFDRYLLHKRATLATRQVDRLRLLAQRLGDEEVLMRLDAGGLDLLLRSLRAFEQREGMIWLQAMEARAMRRLLDGISLAPPAPRDKRPFVQALFCIDTRSERYRRQLEGVGDYQTFGIAGFFGVPISFMELGRGGETHLCPVLLTPKNLVLEMTAAGQQDEAALSTLEKAMHELKESVLTPFVTVEAIGLLFGFDMVGRTIAPQIYNRWRKRLHKAKPPTHLLLDKLSREQADSIVRAVQRAVIVKAVEQELGLAPERITDAMIRELRESALGNRQGTPALSTELKLDKTREQDFIERLRGAYRINPSFARLQMERLGRIGFTLDEQTRFVSQALRSIGLTTGFSRFILLVGHGSTSENNPYESALDCGACGGNHGLISARVLAQMANKPEVRRRLRTAGIEIADDAWFVPALHNTTTDQVSLTDLELLPPSHLIYLDRLRSGLVAASRLCAAERLPTLQIHAGLNDPAAASRGAQRNAVDWSQVRPEWGLSRNAYFVIGRRSLTRSLSLDGRAFLHSYDYRLDPKRRLLENILTGPLVVGQWINMEHYFSTVDSDAYGSGSKVYHNVAGRFAVMTGNLSDLRTGLPAQTVLDQGEPFHQPLRLITAIQAPFEHARRAIEGVVTVKRLLRNGWIRMLIIDPETTQIHLFQDDQWHLLTPTPASFQSVIANECAS